MYMDNYINIKTKDENKIKKLKARIAWTFGIIGLVVILGQLVPLTYSFLQGEFHMFKERIVKDPLPESYKQYIANEFAYYDPGRSYFANLGKTAENLEYSGMFSFDPRTQSTKPIIVDREYSRDMKIDIDSVGIKGIKITSNVESHDEKIYNKYLKFGLAHFKGTPLPGDGGNSFIYGHSAVQNFFNRHSDLPETIFTRLEGVDIGDTVVVNRDGESLKYTVRNKKIVSPEDFSILKTQGDKETLTMMTCWPLGMGTKRLIVVAERY
jgi:LPXTG-site transpeptidase (sortase) family protein